MPAHSSHLLQLLDVGCFSPLKTAYGRQAETLMRNRITHITKLKFLPCFKGAFNAAITKSNILGGFQGASLVPFDPEAVISKLDVRLRTPTPPTVKNCPWQSRTPSNTLEFGSQSKLIRERIQRHANSSPTSIVRSLDQLTKGAKIIAHTLVLMRNQVAKLQAANEASKRRRSHKRKRLQQDSTLTIDKSVRLTTLKEFGARSDRKKAKKRVRGNDSGQPSRRCTRCSRARHNRTTCKKNVDVLSK
jgi:hypothetical protein